MARPDPVRGRPAFQALRREGRRGRCGVVTVRFVSGPPGAGARVAYATGRHVGGAVVRNRVRRRLRAVAAELAAELAEGNYLVSVGAGAAEVEFRELRQQMTEACRRAAGPSGSPAAGGRGRPW